MSHILALDQGTTSCRAILWSDSGEVAAVAQREFKQHYPRPGWVEHDADEIWTTQLEVACQALEQAKLSPSDIAGLGITNQRETTVVWDRKSGQPIHRAIVWQDRRTADTCQRLQQAGHADRVCAKTGLVLDAYFTGTKAAWILDHVPDARAAAERGDLAVGTIDSWLVYKLTAGRLHLTDVSNASRTLLLDLHKVQWDDELLQLFNVPRAALPEVCSSSQIYGEVDGSLPLAGIPIAGIAGDQQAATFGQACFQEGQTKNTYGTGCFALLNTGTRAVPSNNRLLTTIAWQVAQRVEYALEGSVFVGGAVVQWLRDELGIIRTASEVEPLAASVPDTGDVFLVPAFAGLGAPHWDPYARGTLLGVTRGTSAAHLARAALESIAFQVVDLVHAMRADAECELSELRSDGGAAANDLLMQLQADLLQIPVVRPTNIETTALGAAYLAGLATGVWSGRDEIAAQWQVDRRFEPQMSADQAAQLQSRWSEAVERAKGWARE